MKRPPRVASEPSEEAKIAVRPAKRLHQLSVFADYRKAVNIDGFSALVVTAQGDGVRFHVSAGKERERRGDDRSLARVSRCFPSP